MSDIVQRLRLTASDLTATMQDFQRIVAAPVLSAQQEATIRVLTEAADKIERLQDRVFAVAGERDEARALLKECRPAVDRLRAMLACGETVCFDNDFDVQDAVGLAAMLARLDALLREVLP